MTDCTVEHRAAENPLVPLRGILMLIARQVLGEKRQRRWIVGVASAVAGIGLFFSFFSFFSFFGWHAPDPERCEPGSAPFMIQAINPSPTIPTICVSVRPKQSPQ
jgi:hypothetical protein